MLMRVASPKGVGPFPAVVDIHGGGWVMGDRKQNAVIDDYLAAHGHRRRRAGIPHAARRAPIPISITDVHLAIRWLKANAAVAEQRPEPGRRPRHVERRASAPADNAAADRSALRRAEAPQSSIRSMRRSLMPSRHGRSPIRCGAFTWRRRRKIKNLLDAHAAYWPNEAAMAEGNPQLIARTRRTRKAAAAAGAAGNQRRQSAGRHGRAFRRRLSQGRRRSDMLQEFEGQPHTFVTRNPDADASKQALEADGGLHPRAGAR